MSISENCHTKGEVGYVYCIITSPIVTFSRIFLDKRKAAAYDHCREGSEIIGRGRKTRPHNVWGHIPLVTLAHAIWAWNSVQSFILRLLLGVIESILTPNTCFWFFLRNYIKFWLRGSYFLLILKACESWELHRIHETYSILYSVSVNPCENSFSL